MLVCLEDCRMLLRFFKENSESWPRDSKAFKGVKVLLGNLEDVTELEPIE